MNPASLRRPDPRIAAPIHAAPAATIVSIGAGSTPTCSMPKPWISATASAFAISPDQAGLRNQASERIPS